MNRYFNVDHYLKLDSSAQAVVDNWLDEAGMLESNISLIEEKESDVLVLSGPIVDSAGFASESENEVKGRVNNDFPWEIVEKSLIQVASTENS